ncbi:MAG: hypothetical protein KatS3mg042_1515 [Rhodothermaceae bacterium]|nr:MAG: hypothetical protein KatS3mg042_1515 [Rhodothermaceae bacterium]
MYPRLALGLFVLALIVPAALAQHRVAPVDLYATWKLVIDLDERAADSALERFALKVARGFLDEVDIRFVFLDDGRLKVITRAFDDDEPDVEYSEWRINDRGELILGEADTVDVEDTVGLWEGGRLVAYEYEDGRRQRKQEVFLRRLQ